MITFGLVSWNLLAELDAAPNAVPFSYLWGLDLADSFEEAGGIGGLLLFTDHTPSTDTCHYPSYVSVTRGAS